MRARMVAACLALGGNLLVSLPLFAAHAAAPPKGSAASQEAPTVGSVSTVVSKVKCTSAKGTCLYGNGVGVVFEGLHWGMSRKQLVEAYGRPGGIIDQEYNPELARMQPGRGMTAKESERDDKKRAFENSFVEFKSTPTGYDASAIRAEYTYRNKEGVMAIETRGLRRYFFFIGAEPGERLWKVYDEVRLGDESAFGKSFQDAAVNTTTMLSQPGKVVAPDAAKNVIAPTVEWQDEKSRLRVVDRSGEGLIGMVLEDKQVVGALPQLRTNKLEDPFALDPSVRAITQHEISDPSADKQKEAPPPAAKPKSKKKH